MDNTELQLAASFVEQTDRHLFLTGKAGTGKTTFLRRLRKTSPKQMVVTAPTGVAAVNARGVTLHSFFQLPFGPLTPGHALRGAHRFSKAKQRLVKSLDLLVIDEISMVRADVLDGVDSVLRRLRRSQRPFGGVQLLMIGDLGQLAPIVKDEEQRILRQFYDSPFFFSSRALRSTEWLTIELRHIYRQTDPRFVELLNRVRDGRLDDRSERLLASRHQPAFQAPEGEGWISLSTHNRRVDAQNLLRLERLPGKATKLGAQIEGDFPVSSCQAPADLELKIGAQVVFLRNDTARPPRYFNGKIGTVAGLSAEEIHVRCPGDEDEIALSRATWDHVTYQLDEASGEIGEKTTGTFTQFPLRLAWAMTIHKSQGLTFERAVIDAGQAFAPGQVYVALSRCKTLDGMVLVSPISRQSIRPDPTIQRFLDEQARPASPDMGTFKRARLEYRWRILREAFDFRGLRKHAWNLLDLVRSEGPVVRISSDQASNRQISGEASLGDAVEVAQQSVFSVSEAFLRELEKHSARGLDPVDDRLVRNRIEKATEYFGDKIVADFMPFTTLRVTTDNQEIEKRLEGALERLREDYTVVRSSLDACADGFEPDRIVRARAKAASSAESGRSRRRRRASIPVPDDTPHGGLVKRILEWRAEQALSQGDVAPNTIIHQQVAFRIARELPASLQALKRINGVGPKTIRNYGQNLLELVSTYRCEEGLADERTDVNGGTEAKKPSQELSFEMFRSGSSPEEIAQKRSLAVSTIEGHLSKFVKTGVLEVGELVSQERQAAINKVLDEIRQDAPLGEVFAALDGKYSHGEIRIVQAHRSNVSAPLPSTPVTERSPPKE